MALDCIDSRFLLFCLLCNNLAEREREKERERERERERGGRFNCMVLLLIYGYAVSVLFFLLL